MTLSGPQALRSLEEALRDIRREEDEISKRLARSAERLTKIREGEAELFRQLASVRLDTNTQAELSGRLSQAEARAREMLKRHASDLSQTEENLKVIDKTLADLSGQRATALGEVEALQGQLRALSEKIEKAVLADPAYAAKKQAADELAAVAAESLRKTEQAEADREEKGRPYREDPLFMYLWERGYGTKNYTANNLVRYLDGLVAQLVRYQDARPNFAMLNEIPLRLREHAERQAQHAAEAEAELDGLESQAIDAAGGKPVRDGLAAAQARIADIDAQMVAAEDQRDEMTKAQRQLAQGSDPAFAQAIAALGETLGREDIKTLLAEARLTQTGQDDTIVAQIEDARQRATEEDNDARDQKERLKTLAARRRELEDIQYEFKKSKFDDPRSSFGKDALVGDMLTDFLKGAISAATYWDSWRGSQSWKQGTNNWGGGVGLPRNGRDAPSGGFNWPDSSIGGGSTGGKGTGFNWPKSGGSWSKPSGGSGSGGFSRPRSGSSGSRKTGGFKTGGGF